MEERNAGFEKKAKETEARKARIELKARVERNARKQEQKKEEEAAAKKPEKGMYDWLFGRLRSDLSSWRPAASNEDLPNTTIILNTL